MFYFCRHSDQRLKHGHNLLQNYGYWLLTEVWDIFLLLPSFLFLILLGYSSPRTQQQVIIIIIAEITSLITATDDEKTISARKDAHPVPSPAHPHTHRFIPNNGRTNQNNISGWPTWTITANASSCLRSLLLLVLPIHPHSAGVEDKVIININSQFKNPFQVCYFSSFNFA